MKKTISFVLILTILLSSNCLFAADTGKPELKRNVTALSLIEEMEKAIDAILTNYKPDRSKDDPFYASVRDGENKISLLKNAIKRDDKDAGKFINDVTTAIGEIRACFRYQKVDNKDVEIGVSALANGWDTFYGHYVEGNVKEGTPLTAEQQKQMDELKAKCEELDKKLSDAEKNIKNSDALTKELKEMREENNRILESQNSTLGFIAALSFFQSLTGWWNGFYRTVNWYYPSYSPWFVDCNTYWRGCDTVIFPMCDTYFIDTCGPSCWDTYWVCDRPISIDDGSYYVIDYRDDIIFDDSPSVFIDTVDDSGTFYIEETTTINETTTIEETTTTIEEY